MSNTGVKAGALFAGCRRCAFDRSARRASPRAPGRTSAMLRRSFGNEVLRGDVQRLRQGFQRVQCGVAATSFHAADISPCAPRNERQLLLRELSFPTKPLHVQTKHSAKFHSAKGAVMRTVVRHTLVNIPH